MSLSPLRLLLLMIAAAALALTGCPTGDDDDDITAPPTDDDDTAADDDDDDDDATDPPDEEYDGPPDGLVAGLTWAEELDADDNEVHTGFTFDGFGFTDELPPADGVAQDLGDAPGPLTDNILSGAISDIALDTWDGDNDAYTVRFPNGGFVHWILEWDDPAGGDYDSQIYCEFENEENPFAIYGIPTEPDLADLSVPEAGVTIVELAAGARCWFFVVGYSGDATTYTLRIIPTGDDPDPDPPGDDDDSATGDDDDSAAGDDDDSAGDDDDSAR